MIIMKYWKKKKEKDVNKYHIYALKVIMNYRRLNTGILTRDLKREAHLP